ncbi:MAG: OmpH family outer membrane protein [Verrucomicrobiaceae bacterium]
MKNFLLTIFGLVVLTSVATAQRLKIATVDMERLFNDYYRTTEIQKEINIERARIQKDNNIRLADIREIEDNIQGLRKQLEDDSLGDKERQDIGQQIVDLRQDGIHKERERSEFLDRRNRSINDRMRKQMRAILNDIQREVSERAKAGNYDYIFDKSGNSSQGIPFVLHAREMTDLTDSLLTEINEGQEEQ